VGYMAPEQVRGEQADQRTDLFALGAVLYEMITGSRAFRRDTAPETMTAILRDDPPDFPGERTGIPSALDRIVRHSLPKNPGERFQSARDVAFALESLSGSSSSAAMPDAPRVKRVSALRPALGVALAIVAVAAGYWLGRRQTARTDSLSFHRLTFRRGTIFNARFDSDGRSILYSASFEGQPPELFSTRRDSPDSRTLGLPGADNPARAAHGEMALIRNRRAPIPLY